MKQPTISEFDGWRQSPVGTWYFDHYLKGYADMSASVNGRAPGTYSTRHEDFAAFVRNAGHISGVEYAIENDPFEDERKQRDEVKSDGNLPVS